MKYRRGLFSYFLIGITIFPAFALYSQTSDENKNFIELRSNPDGVTVQLEGEYIINGVTPLKIPYRLNGLYKIKASRYGYENLKSTYDFSPQNNKIYYFNLQEKRRLKAFLRSFLFPGWGQFYSDRKIQGVLLAGTELSSIIYTLDKYNKYKNVVNEYEHLLKEYKKGNLSYLDRKDMETDISNKERKADELFNNYQLWLTISASVWIYNVLDAIFFFHYDRFGPLNEMIPKLSSSINTNQLGLRLTWDF